MRLPCLVSLVLLSACSTSNPASTRSVQGQLAGWSSQSLVAARTAAGDSIVAAPSAAGSFRLDVPTGQPVQLQIAERVPGGGFRSTSVIGPAWFRLTPGAPIDLGVVRPTGTSRPATASGGVAVHLCPATAQNAELPYDAKLALGQTWSLSEAFAEKGPQPTQVVSVTMEGTAWRLAELNSGAAFTVTQADCSHAGNRDVGRDRVFVTWKNADGSQATDHLDLRYCEGGGGGSSSSPSASSPAQTEQGDCGEVEVDGCPAGGTVVDSTEQLEECGGPPCPGQGGANGSACTTAAACSSQLCVNGVCQGPSGGSGADAGIN